MAPYIKYCYRINKLIAMSVKDIKVKQPIEVEELQCKVAKITAALSERLDADGIDDINLPKKITWLWVLANVGSVSKMIKEIIAILKNPCFEEIKVVPVEPKQD